MKNAFKILFGKLEGKRPLGRPRRKWRENIKMHFKVECQCGLDLCDSGQGSVAGSCKRGNKPYVSIRSGEFLEQPRSMKFTACYIMI
jgi:hypothetical protein